MIDYVNKAKYNQNSIDKQISIVYGNNTITNSMLHQEEFTLTEGISEEQELRFGSFQSAELQFRVSSVAAPLIGEMITVSETLDGDTAHPFQFGIYKVVSDKPTADRSWRDIVAYDALYEVVNSDVSEWYNTLLPNANSTCTLKQFRDSFFLHFGITQVDVTLANDSMTVEKTIEPSELSGQRVLQSILEINAAFGHINRQGQFAYITLSEVTEGVYPNTTLYPSNSLYPAFDSGAESITRSLYTNCRYEDYLTSRITQLIIRQEDNDAGATVGTTGNTYIIQDNFLVYGKSASDMTAIANTLLPIMYRTIYVPCSLEVKGNPCLEVGDGIIIATASGSTINSYILNRTLRGIQSLMDSYLADGVEKYSADVNSLQSQIIQLKGKTSKLQVDIDGVRTEVSDLETSTNTRFTQTNDAITLEASRATTAEGLLSGQISLTAEGISLEVSRATDAEEALSGRIDLTPTSISMTVTNGYKTAGIRIQMKDKNGNNVGSSVEGTIEMTGLVTFNSLTSSGTTQIDGARITTGTISANRLDLSGTLSVGGAASDVNNGNTTINGGKITANSITAAKLSVTKLSAIVADLGDITAGSINIGNNKFKVTSSGVMSCTGATISGTITAEDGEIGGFTIGATKLYNGKSSLTASASGVYIGNDGIALGTGSTFKVTSAGAVSARDITITGGLIQIGGPTGSVITSSKVAFGDTKLESSGLTIKASGMTNAISFTGAGGGTTSYGYLKFGGDIVMAFGNTFSSGYSNSLQLRPNALCLGASGSLLGFFGISGTVKQTVNTATTANVVSILNTLLTKLAGYGLINKA